MLATTIFEMGDDAVIVSRAHFGHPEGFEMSEQKKSRIWMRALYTIGACQLNSYYILHSL